MKKIHSAVKITALLLGISHLAIISLYLVPANPLTNTYRSLVNWYMNPILKQNWRLFAPDPQPFSLKLYYKCNDSGNWVDPHSALLRNRQDMRLGSSGKILYVYHAMIRNLMNEKIAICNKDQEGCSNPVESSDVLRSQSYLMMKSYVGTLCPSGQFRFRVAQVYSKNFSQRNSRAESGKTLFDEYEVR